jgi:TonB family protein
VLVLAILGLLAAASPADTTVRVPGTTLRFGLADTVISARGFAAATPGVRKGPCRFYGLTSDATLTFEDGRLARAEFAVNDASASELDYVHDQLTAMGYRKSCAQSSPGVEVCDWAGRALVHITVKGANLKASIVSARGAEAAARDTARSAVPARPTRPAGTVPAPAPPPVLRDTSRSTVPAASAVPVLPETLAVNIPGRASAYAPARLRGEPHCDYPEAARAAGIQGRVWVFVLVDTDGHVMRTQLKSGIAVLNAAALECARGWSFEPVTWKGAPCQYWVLVPVAFTAH